MPAPPPPEARGRHAQSCSVALMGLPTHQQEGSSSAILPHHALRPSPTGPATARRAHSEAHSQGAAPTCCSPTRAGG